MHGGRIKAIAFAVLVISACGQSQHAHSSATPTGPTTPTLTEVATATASETSTGTSITSSTSTNSSTGTSTLASPTGWTGAEGSSVEIAGEWQAMPAPPLGLLWGTESAISAGSKLLVAGVDTSCSCKIAGAVFDPSTNSWTGTSSVNIPSTRFFDTNYVWTGTEVFVWGGLQLLTANTAQVTNTGARFNPDTNTWVTVPATSAPAARQRHRIFLDGHRVIVTPGLVEPDLLGTHETDPTQWVFDVSAFDLDAGTWSQLGTVNASSLTTLPVDWAWSPSQRQIVAIATGLDSHVTYGAFNVDTGTWTPSPVTDSLSNLHDKDGSVTRNVGQTFLESTDLGGSVDVSFNYFDFAQMKYTDSAKAVSNDPPLTSRTLSQNWASDTPGIASFGGELDTSDGNGNTTQEELLSTLVIAIPEANAIGVQDFTASEVAPREGSSLAWVNGDLYVWGGVTSIQSTGHNTFSNTFAPSGMVFHPTALTVK